METKQVKKTVKAKNCIYQKSGWCTYRHWKKSWWWSSHRRTRLWEDHHQLGLPKTIVSENETRTTANTNQEFKNKNNTTWTPGMEYALTSNGQAEKKKTWVHLEVKKRIHIRETARLGYSDKSWRICLQKKSKKWSVQLVSAPLCFHSKEEWRKVFSSVRDDF